MKGVMARGAKKGNEGSTKPGGVNIRTTSLPKGGAPTPKTSPVQGL